MHEGAEGISWMFCPRRKRFIFPCNLSALHCLFNGGLAFLLLFYICHSKYWILFDFGLISVLSDKFCLWGKRDDWLLPLLPKMAAGNHPFWYLLYCIVLYCIFLQHALCHINHPFWNVLVLYCIVSSNCIVSYQSSILKCAVLYCIVSSYCIVLGKLSKTF